MAFRVLIVANGFVQGAPDSFPPDVRKTVRAAARGARPGPNTHRQTRLADLRHWRRNARSLDAVSDILADMQRKGIERPPSGHVGDEDQLLAIEDALAQFGTDAVVIIGHVRGQDKWHERHVIERAREQLGFRSTRSRLPLGGGGLGTAPYGVV